MQVYDCERQDGERFAVKVYHALKGDEDQDTILYAKRCQAREIEYLKLLRHPNIIGIEETCFKDELIYVVMEKMTCNLLQVGQGGGGEYTQRECRVMMSNCLPSYCNVT